MPVRERFRMHERSFYIKKFLNPYKDVKNPSCAQGSRTKIAGINEEKWKL